LFFSLSSYVGYLSIVMGKHHVLVIFHRQFDFFIG
jgi:hypothetical protein